MTETTISVFQDENGDYTVIAGTDNRALAERALRAQEEEWFGPLAGRSGDGEMPIPMDKFYAADIYEGIYKGEQSYYWGDNPDRHFDDGKFTTEPGFITSSD